ncbi:MAG: hypothetical protein JXD22_09790 [Sedimentisphaerales bacterium]|nr:hypothetical protein [Sedimentisphaerales bacterium]
MKHQTFLKGTLLCLLVLALFSLPASAQQNPARSRGIFGDWQITINYDDRQMDSILAFSRDQQRKLTAQWISFRNVTDLIDVTYEEGKLSFVQVRQNRQGETTESKFTGTIKEQKLTGTLSSDRGEFKVTGKPLPRIPRPIGSWEINYKIGERDVTSTLLIKQDKEGKLLGQWQSQRGEHTISDMQYERGKLTFKRNTKIQDRQFDSTFDCTIQGDTLTAVITSDRGEITAQGKRLGAPLIGTWNLELVSGEEENRRTSNQRLKVNPDLTALYGATPVPKVNLQDGKVTFKIVLQFGERTFEMNFEGKIEADKLTGQMKTTRGIQKVTGKKVVRTPRRRPPATI